LGFLGGIFGNSRIKVPRPERFQAVARAAESLRSTGGLKPGDTAGLLFNPEEGASMSALAVDLQGILREGEATSATTVDLEMDDFDTGWIVLRNDRFEDLVASVQALNVSLFERGNGDRLLAAVLRVDFERLQAYWIYNYKLGRFYPLVRPGDGHVSSGDGESRRDNAAELRLGEMMEANRVAIESSLSNWFGLSGIPF
jgi:hypothetical protein